jgi:hypothetical protein
MKEANLEKTMFYAEVAEYCNSLTYQGSLCYDFNLVTTSEQIHALMGALISGAHDFIEGNEGEFTDTVEAEGMYFESAWDELGL